MEIGDWAATEDLNQLYRDIRELGLETNIAELDAFGFTVIPNALSPEDTAKARDAVVGAAEKRFGQPLDLENETQHQNTEVAAYLLFTNPIFEKVVLNPKPLALITYLVGRSCVLSSLTSHVKGPGERALRLHSDSAATPTPLSAYSHVANVNYALTDYTEAGGCLAIVPGSHRWARHPTEPERDLWGNNRNPLAIPIEVPAGSAVIWHGNTWHGSFPRQIPGLRINLATYYVREYFEPQELYRYNVPEDFLARHGRDSRMATLMGLNKFNGWTEEGPDMVRLRSGGRTVGRSWHA